MSHLVVFLFPGLGAHSPGVLRATIEQFPEAAEVFVEVDHIAEEFALPAPSDLVFNTTTRTDPAATTQLAIFGTSMALHRILTRRGVEPDILLGHSFGELAALTAAGALTLADGARLVCHRVAALADWEGRGAMLAIGVDARTAQHMIGAVEARNLVLACRNAPRQSVISGPATELDAVARVAAALDIPTSLLNLPYPSHHRMMAPAVAPFLDLCSTVVRHPLRTPVYSPMHDRYYGPDDDVVARFAEGVTRPVDFVGAVRELHAENAQVFVEVGALRALTRCVERTVPAVRTHAPLADSSSVVTALHSTVTDLGGSAPQVPATSPEPAPAEPTRTSRREALVNELRALYADALEYPVEEVTEDVELEAHLGVDSLKQVALLTRLFREHGVIAPGDGIPVWEYRTVGHVADLLLAQGGGGAS